MNEKEFIERYISDKLRSGDYQDMREDFTRKKIHDEIVGMRAYCILSEIEPEWLSLDLVDPIYEALHKEIEARIKKKNPDI